MREVGRCRGGSSISVSVSPAHSWPGVVQIDLTLSRPRDEAYEDTLPKMRIRRLVVDFDFETWALLYDDDGLGLVLAPHVVYGRSSSSSRSSSLSLFNCIRVDMGVPGRKGGISYDELARRMGEEGEEFDFGIVKGPGERGE